MWSNNDKEFVLQLLHQEHVLVVHGSGFSPEKGLGHIRIVYLADEDTLNTAFNRIDSFLQRNRTAKK
jgi:aspartate/methionine/tyrosine aminotransferase